MHYAAYRYFFIKLCLISLGYRFQVLFADHRIIINIRVLPFGRSSSSNFTLNNPPLFSSYLRTFLYSWDRRSNQFCVFLLFFFLPFFLLVLLQQTLFRRRICPIQFFFWCQIVSIIVLVSSTIVNSSSLVLWSVHFTFSILLHISNACCQLLELFASSRSLLHAVPPTTP